MAEVYFYQLKRSPQARTLATLLARSLDQGWRVAVRGTDRDRLAALDDALWQGGADDFLPHGLEGGRHDTRQPVLLCLGEARNGADALISVDGAEVAVDEVTGLRRASILFDGNDDDALARARDQWRALTGAGLPARYWSEESGKWAEKASRNLPE